MDDFLSVKTDKSMIIPSTLEDFRALIDKADVMNQTLPYLSHLSSDDFFILTNNYASLTNILKRNAYVWKKDLYEGTSVTDWNRSFHQIFYANNVLDGLQNLKSEEIEARHLEGGALFFRAFAYYNLSQVFCAPYDIKGENGGLGLPLRLKSDISEVVGRSTVEDVYMQMEKDLTRAIVLLPEQSTIKTRPTQFAAALLLARVQLLMGNYEGALSSSQRIMDNFELLDFNTLNASATYPMGQFNKEVLLHSSMSYTSTVSSTDYVDTLLIGAYEKDDLRATSWFVPRNGYHVFKGSYTGGALLFNGLAVDEAYLIAAECSARLNLLAEAKRILLEYLTSRYANNVAVDPVTGDSQADVLRAVLLERRKGLLYRGIRWSDIRRLNKNDNAGITISRMLEGQVISLIPNSLNYVLPIPDEVIFLSGIAQNPRE
ncbi:RagB/SusD family nutrient uptake outer membrane protein [Sphingobacterium lumbrici]|uniref:RagB/SusD family nutrient uptake outer membrane protein n=1 Tax=Sphingobacterium lumbrici TaxID=2559600 RepID=UPI0015E28A7B|nr:RagB/SusD family nutrient uptake outer membrane protein [Sphingobacterium lumbrici]